MTQLLNVEQLQQRIQYCLAQSLQKETIGDKEFPGEYAAQYAARHLYLEGVLENWEDLEKDELGQAEVDEENYTGMLDNLCEDEGLPDVYENGPESSYSWMVWAKVHEIGDFCEIVKEYMEENDLPVPEWARETDSFWFPHFHNN